MKRFIIIICSLLMSLSFNLTAADRKLVNSISEYESCIQDAELLLFIPADDESQGGVGYIEGDFANIGPQSFAVENDKIYVLDTVKNRIIIKSSDHVSYITLESDIYPKHMCVIGGSAFITSYDTAFLYEVDLASASINIHSLPNNLRGDSIFRLCANHDGTVSIVCYDYKSYNFNHITDTWDESGQVDCKVTGSETYEVYCNKRAVSVIAEENTVAQYVGCLNDGTILFDTFEYVPNVPIIMFERSLRLYNDEGKLVGCTLINDENIYTYPEQDVYISSDGIVYVMYSLNDGVYVTRPNFRSSYNSNMNRIIAETNKMKNELETYATREVMKPITSHDRDTVYSRAVSCKNYTWSFNPLENATIRYRIVDGVQYHIVLPTEEAGISTTTTLTGIPYCRGMHDGPSAFSNKLNQIYTGDDLNKKYTAGNVADKYIYGSTGLDCSGFACYAYEAPVSDPGTNNGYWTTVSFATNGAGYYVNSTQSNSTVNTSSDYETQAHFANMKIMDFLVKSDNHIALYYSWYTTASVNVIHASRNVHGKIYQENYQFKYLKGFYMKSPYSCTLTGCTGSSYYNNNFYHWKICSVCGIKIAYSQHNWVAYNSKYRCSVCGKIVSSIPQPSKTASDACQ